MSSRSLGEVYDVYDMELGFTGVQFSLPHSFSIFFLALFEIVHITWLYSTNCSPQRIGGPNETLVVLVTGLWCVFNGQILLVIFSQSLGDRHLFHWDLHHHHHHIPWGKRLDVENGPICGLFDPKETHGENPHLFVNVYPGGIQDGHWDRSYLTTYLDHCKCEHMAYPLVNITLENHHFL